MNIHEFQAKAILQSHGVPVLPGGIASNTTEAIAVARVTGGDAWMVKAQVHAGGRGKAGGVVKVTSPENAGAATEEMLGTRLVTAQTGPNGKEIKCIYIEKACDIQTETYIAILVDRSSAQVTFIASSQGGVEIEKSAGTIIRLPVNTASGLVEQEAADFARQLGFDDDHSILAVKTMQSMYSAFLDTDASLIEINPLAVTKQGEVYALDVKMILDDNALFRHPELATLRDIDEVEPDELEAQRFELNFVRMQGDIGVMVTGAGLALATIDIIKNHGGEAADFMDVRPMASREQVAAGIEMLLGNRKIESIMVNVMGGGILRCDNIAEGVALAWRNSTRHIPIIVRIAGTGKELAVLALNNQKIPVTFADDLNEAAKLAVQAAKQGEA